MATDGGNPSRSDTSSVLVTVSRNLNSPEFLQQNATINVFENQNLGESIYSLQARDLDISVCITWDNHCGDLNDFIWYDTSGICCHSKPL